MVIHQHSSTERQNPICMLTYNPITASNLKRNNMFTFLDKKSITSPIPKLVFKILKEPVASNQDALHPKPISSQMGRRKTLLIQLILSGKLPQLEFALSHMNHILALPTGQQWTHLNHSICY